MHFHGNDNGSSHPNGTIQPATTHNGEHNKEHKARTQPTNAPDSNPILVPDT